jgi:2-oxoglutarate dehydrogenase E2 component (dihydrolipoamide succinyltransferase)
MDERVEISLPKLGESIVGATVVQWLKKEGDYVKLDEPLVEVSTDKVNSEIPSPVAGILQKIVAEVDQEIEVGTVIAYIQATSKAPQVTETKEVAKDNSGAPCPLREEFFTPSVLRLAQAEGISIETLRTLKGTGDGGRITKKDIESHLQGRNKKSDSSREEHVKLTGMRKLIADNMVRSFYEAPHASIVIEADVTDVSQIIKREKESFFIAHGFKLTITSFLIQALTKAIQQFPMLNSSLVEETIVMKRYVNVGIAVHVEQGLVVPVIKNCQDRNLVSIAKEVGDLSNRARTHKLFPDDVTEGTVTLTNFGMTGALLGVPIIRYPEVAIIGVGTIKKRVVVRDDDSLAIRQMMYLTLTFDHRVIDGIYGCEFLSAVKNNLESVVVH